MRDLLFKNLTSENKKRRILSSSETMDKQGVHSVIHRHFICQVKEIKDKQMEKPEPYMYVLKERNSKEQTEKFFCRVKGGVYGVAEGKLFLILFTHSLKVCLTPATETGLLDNSN